MGTGGSLALLSIYGGFSMGVKSHRPVNRKLINTDQHIEVKFNLFGWIFGSIGSYQSDSIIL